MQLQPSRLFAAYLILLLALSITALYFSLGLLYCILIAIPLTLHSTYLFYRLALLKSPKSWLTIKHFPDCIELTNQAHETYCAELLPDTTVTPFVIVLRLKFEQYKLAQSLLIFPDSLSKQDFHRLRVLLRFAHTSVKI